MYVLIGILLLGILFGQIGKERLVTVIVLEGLLEPRQDTTIRVGLNLG